MAIVGGFDIHRRQITYDYIDTVTGENGRGRISPADRGHLHDWLSQFGAQEVDFALEGCTGWLFVVQELHAAHYRAHLADPAETAALRGPKKRAKTDRADARLLRELLQSGSLPESWIPPAHVVEARTTVRLYKSLVEERTAWLQRIHALVFQHGLPASPELRREEGRNTLDGADLPPAAHQAVLLARRAVDDINRELDVLREQITDFSRRQLGSRALQTHFGIGELLSVAIWAELGDCRRFSSSSDAVRHSGLDVSVSSSDTKRARGHLARQGPPVLRWALYEAAKCGARSASPDHEYYVRVRERLGAQRASLSLARKLVRRCHHTLRALGDEAMGPPAPARRAKRPTALAA